MIRDRKYLLGASCLLTSWVAGGCVNDAAAPPPPLPMTTSLARIQQADSLAMANQYAVWAKTHPGGGSMPLDFSNDLHYSVIQHRLLASGKTAGNSPELFSRLAAARVNAAARKAIGRLDVAEPAWACAQGIPFDELPAQPGHFTAQALSSCPDGAEYSYTDVNSYATDAAHHDFVFLSATSSDDFAATFAETQKIAGNVEPGPGRQLYMDSIVLAFQGTKEFAGVIPMDASAAAADRPDKLDSVHPREIQNIPNEDEIRVCLFRLTQTAGGHDCDYGTVTRQANGSFVTFPPNATGLAAAIATNGPTWTPDPTSYFPAAVPMQNQNGSNVIAYVPLEGTYDSGAVLRRECQNQGTTGTVQLFLTETGGGCVGTPVNVPVTGAAALPWTSADPASSQWTYRGLVDFGSTCLRQLQTVRMVVTILNPAPLCGGARNQSKQIQPIDFRNSCLAEGTLVTTSTGKSVAVEKLAIGDKVVADGRGGVLTVQAIAHGVEPSPMVRLRDDHGHQVLVTQTHPMLTGSGSVIAASKLTVGDQVMTRQGPSRLVAVERVAHSGRVFNFVLGSKQELASLGPDHRTLFANGFLVGDNVMQRALEERSKRQRPDVASRLPRAWLEDYRRSVARKAVAAR